MSSTSPTLMTSLQEADTGNENLTSVRGKSELELEMFLCVYQVDLRRLILVAEGLTGVNRFVRGKHLLGQVQLPLPLVAERYLPGLEQDARLPVGQHLLGGDNSISAKREPKMSFPK